MRPKLVPYWALSTALQSFYKYGIKEILTQVCTLYLINKVYVFPQVFHVAVGALYLFLPHEVMKHVSDYK